MKTLSASVLALGLLAVPAMAADIAPAPDMLSWDGVYGGIVGGYTWNSAAVGDVTFQDNGGPLVKTPIHYSTDVDGGELGGTLGFNYQTGALVLGVEGDISYAWASGSNSKYKQDADFSSDTELSWFGTARLRSGYAFDRALVYVTGGLAYGDVEGKLHDGYDGEVIHTNDNNGMWGWTLGGGLEYAVTDHVSVKGEYLYYDLGNENFSFSESAHDGWDHIKSNVAVTGSVLRAGLNYRF